MSSALPIGMTMEGEEGGELDTKGGGGSQEQRVEGR